MGWEKPFRGLRGQIVALIFNPDTAKRPQVQVEPTALKGIANFRKA
jgi:hypothetical protein